MDLPYRYSNLRGTAWFRRFFVEEYSILLDKGPDRYIIEDREVPKDACVSRLTDYRAEIIRLFTEEDDKLAELSPLEILRILRNLKAKKLGIRRVIEPLPDREEVLGILNEYRGLTLTAKIAASFSAVSAAPVAVMDGLDTIAHDYDRVVLLPGRRDSWPYDAACWLSEPSLRLVVVVQDDPADRGVDKVLAGHVGSLIGEGNVDDYIEGINPPFGEDELSLLRKIAGPRGLLVVRGMWPFFSLFRSSLPFLALLDDREWLMRPLLGGSYGGETEKDGERKPPEVIAISDIAVQADRKSCSLAGMMTQPFPESVDVTGVRYSSLNLPAHMIGLKPLKEEVCWERKRRRMKSFLRGRGAFGDVRSLPLRGGCKALVGYAVVEPDLWRLEPVLPGRRAVSSEIDVQGGGFLANFAYFYTKNLADIYRLRTGDDLSCCKDDIIDYIGRFDENGGESLPLYAKGLFGVRKDGSLFIGYAELEKAELNWNGGRYLFNSESINPVSSAEHGKACPSLFLPSYYKRRVDAGESGVAIVQDRIIFLCRGQTAIPPLGVIVTGIPGLEEGTVVSWRPVFKGLNTGNFRWLFGGYNILITNGKNLYLDVRKGQRALAAELWGSEASMLTQETQLYAGIRQPRTFLGRSASGKILLGHVTGRTEQYPGATFGETASIAKRLLPETDPLEALINLDGGASSFLGFCLDTERFPLGLPSASTSNPCGWPRPIPGFLRLRYEE